MPADARSRSLVFCQPNGNPIDQMRDRNNWSEILAAADLPAIRLHDARHTSATLLLAQGVATAVVMEMFGQGQVSMTLKNRHPVATLQRDAADRMGAALWGST
jgi:integrase